MHNSTLIIKKQVTDARIAWKLLNGIIAVHKPSGVHFLQLRHTLQLKLCKDLNNMKVRPPMPYVELDGDTREEMNVTIRPSYSDNILVVGPRYKFDDIRISVANKLETDSSGLMLLGINDGNRISTKIKQISPMKLYKVKGILGQGSDNYFKTGKIVEKSTFNHVRQELLDKVCASMQSAHQRKMFEFCGVDIQSQAAYELALQGPIRPADKNIPMIYSMKCVHFAPPEFIIEISCMNENEMYLKTIIHDIGLRLNTNATCTQLHCIQVGVFKLSLALLQSEWTVSNVLSNMSMCKQILAENKYLLKQRNPALIDPGHAAEQ